MPIKSRLQRIERGMSESIANRVNAEEYSRFVADSRQAIDDYLNDRPLSADLTHYHGSDGRIKYEFPADFFSQYTDSELRLLKKWNDQHNQRGE